MKNIIKRNLPLDVQYHIVDKKYIPLLDGGGCSCDNCGKLIANIATIKDANGNVSNIGFDCLETILINNNLLSGLDVEQYQAVKKMIPKAIRLSKVIKEVISKNPRLTGIRFEKPSYESDWLTFYWLFDNEVMSRNNDNIKLKDCDFNFIVETIANIFPKLTILFN